MAKASKPKKSDATNEVVEVIETDQASQPRAKRRLRVVSSETLREKTIKAQEAADKPAKKRPAGILFSIIKFPFKVLAWVSHKPPLKQLGHALRWFFSLRLMRFLGKILGLTYIRDSFKELKLVSWPSRTESRRLTIAVIIFSFVFGIVIAGVDYGLDKLFKQVILK